MTRLAVWPLVSVVTAVPSGRRIAKVPLPVQEMVSTALCTMSIRNAVVAWTRAAVPISAEPSAWAPGAIQAVAIATPTSHGKGL